MFHSVADRCFVDFSELGLPLETDEVICLLSYKKFQLLDVDVTEEARAYVGRAKFSLGVRMSESPALFDCSSFMKWVYGRKGIWVPRLAVQQYEFGTPVDLADIVPGDLIFTSGFCSRSWYIGHVGLYTGESVITAMIQGSKSGVFEMSLSCLLGQREFRSARRIITSQGETSTLVIPPGYEIETSDDVKHFVLSLIT